MMEPEKGTEEEAVTENSGKRIPAGKYTLMKYYGNTNKHVFLLMNVPGRTTILIHIGNFHNQTTGCFLTGSVTLARNTVENSKNKLNELKDLVVNILGVKDFESIPVGKKVGTITIIDPVRD